MSEIKSANSVNQTEEIPQICRISCVYQYLTPTKRRNIWEITFFNPSEEPAWYIIIDSNAYLPGFKIRDSNGNKLMVVPRHLLPDNVQTSEYTMFIQLKQELLPGDFETIQIQSISTLPADKELAFDNHLFGFVRGEFKPEIEMPLENKCSWYVSVFIPKEYSLKVNAVDGCEDIYHDQNSYVLRTFSKEAPKLSMEIRIPSRITLWLLVGSVFSFLIPLFSSIVFWAGNITISFSMIFGAIAAILAMRAWLFYSVELLDRFNKLFLSAFTLNLITAFILIIFYGASSTSLSHIGLFNNTYSNIPAIY